MDLVCYELVSPELVRPKLVYSSVVSPSWFCLYGACPSWICQWSFSVLILSVLNYSIKFLRPDFVSIRCLSVLNLSKALRLILRPKFSLWGFPSWFFSPERNWVIATNFDFITLIYFQRNVLEYLIFQT